MAMIMTPILAECMLLVE
ncbi:Protein of unknown function [Bacillus mycoides]|nr:Protein of unknown function [Bacillus mycoides]